MFHSDRTQLQYAAVHLVFAITFFDFEFRAFSVTAIGNRWLVLTIICCFKKLLEVHFIAHYFTFGLDYQLPTR